MNFTCEHNHMSPSIVFSGRITMEDLVKLRLDPTDEAMLRKQPRTVADALLVLELLFRRYLEQTPTALTLVNGGARSWQMELKHHQGPATPEQPR